MGGLSPFKNAWGAFLSSFTSTAAAASSPAVGGGKRRCGGRSTISLVVDGFRL
jgi:hypothetical protein